MICCCKCSPKDSRADVVLSEEEKRSFSIAEDRQVLTVPPTDHWRGIITSNIAVITYSYMTSSGCPALLNYAEHTPNMVSLDTVSST